MGDKPIKILIAEWVPSLNKGELAILKGMLKTFKALGKVEVSIFSFCPYIDKKRYPKNVKIIDIGSDLCIGYGDSLIEASRLVEAKAFFFSAVQHLFFALAAKILGKNVLRFMNKSVWKEYYRSDVIIICHDGVSCVGGFVLFLSPLYITLLAKFLRKPIVIYANGTHSFGRKIWKILATFVLNSVDLITVRDEESFSYLKKFVWNKARIHLTGDPAILLPSVDSRKVREIMLREGVNEDGGLLVGVAISHEVLSSAFRGYMNTDGAYRKAVREIAKVLDRLVESFQASIVFVPHCIEPYHRRDDRIIAREIHNAMKNKHKVHIITNEYSPEELKGLIGQFDIFISSRIHSVINALSMGVPTCCITRSSDKRACGLIGKMLMQERWIYNVENLNANNIFTHIATLISNSNKIRSELPSIIRSAKKRAMLNGKLLKALLDSRKNQVR